jgi:nitrous oxidase accessory protein
MSVLRKIFVWVFSLFFGANCLVHAATIKVNPGNDQKIIQKAIDAAAPHDTIMVMPGIYMEWDIVIDKPLFIIGVDYPVIDGDHMSEIITIGADSVVFRGFKVQHVGFSYTKDWAAIKIDSKNYCTIEDNILLDSFFGIYLKKTNYTTVRNNILRGKAENEVNSGNGIHLWYCNDVLIENNQVFGHRDGIYLEFVERSKIVRKYQ